MVVTREYSLVVYGATGFTGTLAAEYVVRQYGSTSLKWAIAGRSEAKLEKLRAALDGKPGIIVADGDDFAALKVLAERTVSVATCAGPFARYGSKLVKACAEAGTAYCDITGEVDWVRAMIDEHDDTARGTGARIVHCCGHDSVPWDLCTLMLSNKLQEAGDAIASVDFYDDIQSSPSGGTLETMFGILSGEDAAKEKKKTAFDPLLRTARGSKSPFALKAANVNALDFAAAPAPSSEYAARSFFVMAGVNANVVKRSNALLGYAETLTYREGLAHASSLSAVANFLGLAAFGVALFVPPLRYLLRRTVLPRPGEGPSREDMLNGYLRVHGYAKGAKGTKAACEMAFAVDPGYMDTARMVVEAALALSLDQDKLNHVPGGSYTPASCQGTVLLDRLCHTGSTFAFLPSPSSSSSSGDDDDESGEEEAS